jgi:hypothetical protein
MNRRRYATREELLALLAGRAPGVDWPVVLEHLEAIGAQVVAPKVTVEESMEVV